MRTGLATYAAIILFIICFPAVMAMGLFGFGFGGLLSLFPGLVNIAMLGLLLVAFANAHGTWHFKEQVRDMAPWMIMMIVLAFLSSLLR